MEIVVGVERRKEGNIKGSATDKLRSNSAPLEQVADPVVYKLVRVGFDGSLVPATDDELMGVGDSLEFEENEVVSVCDVETVQQDLDKDGTSNKPLLMKNKGSTEDKDEEVDRKKLQVRFEDTMPLSASNLNNECVNQSENTVQEANFQDGLSKKSSVGLQPDFSCLKGEINLDKLTIRELQETFRATFGRETSAKDKLWLKRRIAMGLTNSCDVSVTSFIIKDGKFLKKEEIYKNVDCKEPVAEVMSAGDVKSDACQNLMESTVHGAELDNSVLDSGHRSDDAFEQKGEKRVRKPTKRYIEELSDKETRETKVIPATKDLGQDQVSVKLPVKTTWDVHTNPMVTRHDSIGGSGVQVPYVSRVRRCRPRKCIMALTRFQTGPGNLMRKTAESSITRSDDVGAHKEVDMKFVPASINNQIASQVEKEKHSSTHTSEVSEASQYHDREPTDIELRDNNSKDNVAGINSDDNIGTVPTPKGGMRRKHHRAWTLTEVMKLVDGVSKFGAGRWSEIKRLSFSSYSYRTSVDLKDKWRNLLKASFVNLPSEKGEVIPRKNMPSPIPAPILVKVRELAELNGQAPRIFKASTENTGSFLDGKNRSVCL